MEDEDDTIGQGPACQYGEIEQETGQTSRVLPTDVGQHLFKEIGVKTLDGERSFELKPTQEPGVFTVTTDESKT